MDERLSSQLTIFNYLQVPAAVLNASGVVLAWNPAMAQLSGIEASSVINRPLLSAWPQLDQAAFIAAIDRASKKKLPVKITSAFAAPDANPKSGHWVDLTLKPFDLAETIFLVEALVNVMPVSGSLPYAELSGIAGATLGVQPFKSAAEVQKYKHILAVTSEGFWMLDPEGQWRPLGQ